METEAIYCETFYITWSNCSINTKKPQYSDENSQSIDKNNISHFT